jgi:6-phosphofructo-2-kinase
MPHNVSDTLDLERANSLPTAPASSHARKQSQHSIYAKSVLMSKIAHTVNGTAANSFDSTRHALEVLPPAAIDSLDGTDGRKEDHLKLRPRFSTEVVRISKDGVGAALSDTPAPSLPTSPRMCVAPAQSVDMHVNTANSICRSAMRTNSAGSTPKIRPTTLDIPGLTKSKVSPDGRIAQRDVGSKLVIVMVGLPARGKSYITKKMARYLNWLQHDTKIFNVGEKRRKFAHHTESNTAEGLERRGSLNHHPQDMSPPHLAAHILISGQMPAPPIPTLSLNGAVAVVDASEDSSSSSLAETQPRSVGFAVGSLGAAVHHDPMSEHNADFFDPANREAALIREQCASETLDDLLDYILYGSGSVGILDATNSTVSRRKMVMERIRQKAGKELNVLFIESVCEDKSLLEANMRLKLSGPDYKDKDPVASLADFKKRVEQYEKKYMPIGDFEERNNMPYIKMIDVGRKVITHQIRGFLSSQAAYYLLNFNLAPRQIWITRHGESDDNKAGKIGGDSRLTENGCRYAAALARFVDYERKAWDVRQQDKAANTHFPPHPGDHTPPNPHFSPLGDGEEEELRNFCVWTSMLKRSVQSSECFDEEDYEVKQMRMLDELNAGIMEGMTYEEIKTQHRDEYELRQSDKLQYRYPGPGGEGYLDVINRLRPVIVELERMTDHCLLITHRSVARVLLAYFMGLRRDQVADLDCPLGMLYSLEPVCHSHTPSSSRILLTRLHRNPTVSSSKLTSIIQTLIGSTTSLTSN